MLRLPRQTARSAGGSTIGSTLVIDARLRKTAVSRAGVTGSPVGERSNWACGKCVAKRRTSLTNAPATPSRSRKRACVVAHAWGLI